MRAGTALSGLWRYPDDEASFSDAIPFWILVLFLVELFVKK